MATEPKITDEKNAPPASLNVVSGSQSNQSERTLLPVPEDEAQLPAKPWSLNPNCKNNLIDRYGEEGGQEMYRRVALKHGHFDPRNEAPGYRPDLSEGDAPGERLDGK